MMSDPSELESDKNNVHLPSTELHETESAPEMPMLEDEEMPTYVSVSSPSRPEDGEIRGEQQHGVASLVKGPSSSPYPNDDQGGGSIYVVSSGEETDRPPFDEEDDTDEEYDTDEMDEMELEDEIDEEEEDDEEDARMFQPEDESDGDIEPELFERASDDLILRHNTGIKRGYKAKSQSLQDLSVCETNRPARLSKKRRSLDIIGRNELIYPQNTLLYPFLHRKSSTTRTNKYCHVESKVRRYIQEIKEQNRYSMEKRLKTRECLMQNNYTNVGVEGINDGNNKVAITNKNIKGYAEKVIRDLEIGEFYDKDEIVQVLPRKLENGLGILEKLTSQDKQYIGMTRNVSTDNESMENQKIIVNYDTKIEKHNGAVKNNDQNHILEACIENRKPFKEANGVSLFNNQEDTRNICNLRTVSYEEYMRCGIDSNHKTENIHVSLVRPEINAKVSYNNEEVIGVAEIDNNELPCSLKIESVKSIQTTAEEAKTNDNNSNSAVEMADERNDSMQDEKSEVTLLKTQLDQKSMQFHDIRESYQKTLAENFELKRELDDLKKALAQYQKEHEFRQTKVVAVQTEALPDEVSVTEPPNGIKQLNSKLSASSIDSAASSYNQWSDSVNSSAMSIKPPPNLTISNSDNSFIGFDGTPKKTVRPLSKAFITSSRILRTLSNITHGRARVDSSTHNTRNSEESNHIKDMTKETNDATLSKLNDISTSNHALNPKKRKATEMLGNLNFLQPSKIPHTSSDSQRKVSSASSANDELRHSEVHSSINPQANPTFVPNDINSLDDSGNTQDIREMKRDDSQIDGVKYFTYQEDEDGKDRSFLIQAEDTDKANERGHVRECGPYLLGNVEIRMSEVNGTINIWGKEISQNSVFEEEDEMTQDLNESSPYSYLQKTPRAQLSNNNQTSYSTNKKLKTSLPPPRFSDSNLSKPSTSTMFNIPKISIGMDELDEEQRANCSCNANDVISGCENRDFQKDQSWINQKRMTNSIERQRSCCARLKEFHEADCNCSWERERCHNRPACSRVTLEDQRYSTTNELNLGNISKHSCTNNAIHLTNVMNEKICKHIRDICHRCIESNVQENDYQHNKKYHCVKGNVCRYDSDNFEAIPTNSKCPNHSNNHLCCHSPLEDNENGPLSSQKLSHETPEQQIKRRRLSGKKVRSILMDFLKSCGDCHNTSYMSTNKVSPQTTESNHLRSCTPSTSSPSTQVGQLQQKTRKSMEMKCCQVCNRRIEMATEIETQLEFFRVEMERLRSRSDAVLDMLNMLHSADLN